MNRKVAALLLSLVMIFSIIVLIVELAPVVKGSDIIYVDDVPGQGPKNPLEDYTSIQAAINAAKDGDMVYVYSGRYKENVEVDKAINLTGENRDNTTIDGNGGDVIQVSTDWVNVSGFTVLKGHIGIWLHRGFQNIQNCRIFNNTAYSNDHGISLLDSSDNWIEGNNVSNNENGIWLSDSDDNTLINNYASSNSRRGIWLDNSCGNTLAGNAMINNGIWIEGWLVEHWNTHNIDTSNTVNGKPVYYWKNQTGGKVPAGAGQVILANCTNVRVEGQELTHGTVGIGLGFSSNNYVVGNNISSNILDGIYLCGSNGNTITGNNASSNYEYGFYLRISNGNSIISNKVSFNYIGFWVLHSSGNNIIDNTVSNNIYGFYFYNDSNSNILVNNIVSSNMAGIWLEEETLNNLIYHNIFMNSPAFDETNNSNQWDNGYPTGGNYWSDFDEPGENAYDDYQGIDQNVSGSDGIVDNGTVGGGGKNPYIIDSDSQDNYPLINLSVGLFLYPGWNLISIPHIQIDRDLGTVLKSIEGSYDTVWWYNVSDNIDHWKVNNISKPPPMNDLDSIDYKMGFWIHITDPYGVLFYYPGIRLIENQTITIHPGWNLVGYPSLANRIRAEALNNITFGTDVDSIWTYNAAIQRWDEVAPSDYFEIGKGYWVHSKVEKVWDVPL